MRGVPSLVLPDNLKSGVNQASFYGPKTNHSYAMMASHYGIGVLHVRPRDKAKVENGVRYGGRRHGTDPDHMPSSHRRYAEWTPERFRRWGAAIGPSTEGLILAILAARPHPEQGFRTYLGGPCLYRDIDKVRAEALSARPVAIGGVNYKSIASLRYERRSTIVTSQIGRDPAKSDQ